MTEERQAEAEVVEPVESAADELPQNDVNEEPLVGEPEAEDEAVGADVNETDAGEEGASPEVVSEAEVSEEEEPLSPEAALIKQLEADLAEAQAAALSQMDQLQRLAAEFQNSKKRQERQLSDAIQRASGHVVERLLPVLDDFDLAFGNLPEDISAEDASWVDGFQQIQVKLASILEDQGVTVIARDGEFDPNLHEAITSEPNDDIESGHIIETLRVGYEFKGRVLRPAMVRVAS